MDDNSTQTQTADAGALATRQGPSAEVLAFQERMLAQALESIPPGPMRLMLNGTAWKALTTQAGLLGRSAFVPDHLRPSKKQIDSGMTAAEQADLTAANVMGALILATSLGESPLQVMADVYFVGGRAAWKTEALIARLRRTQGISVKARVDIGQGKIKGQYKKVEWKETNSGKRFPEDKLVDFEAANITVTAYATDRNGAILRHEEPQLDGSTRLVPTVATVTMAQAIADGWVSNEKYATLPERMLTWRATSYWISLHHPEAKSGIPMDVELESLPPRQDVEVYPVPSAAAQRPTPRPLPAIAATEEPVPTPAPPAAPVPVQAPTEAPKAPAVQAPSVAALRGLEKAHTAIADEQRARLGIDPTKAVSALTDEERLDLARAIDAALPPEKRTGVWG